MRTTQQIRDAMTATTALSKDDAAEARRAVNELARRFAGGEDIDAARKAMVGE